MFGLEMPDKKRVSDFEVVPSAWPAVLLFLTLQTQWRVGSAGIVGLDYNAVRWVFELYEVAEPRKMLDDLQIIEATVVETLNEREK
ncbi:MAG: hypothetical protein Unbinned4294contig1002_43 [Prokaryotic dsDNA virus sp.]|nr:MAG: hypothetical protein Unbinned4294contig1002_43 [Prokaryotic dsDNA virus sp.]